jgi:hypothetical protein
VGDEAIVYVDRSAVRPGKADALIAALAELAALVEARHDQIVAYQVHFDASRSTSASSTSTATPDLSTGTWQ